MSPLEQLFALEVEFHRRLRTEAPGTGDAAATHTSYALQSGYEQLLQRVGQRHRPGYRGVTGTALACR